MGLFTRRKVIGSMRLDFVSSTEVAVSDNIPTPTAEAHYPLLFAFMYAGKLLSNFPPPTGQDVLARAIRLLGSRIHAETNGSMLGVCCERPLAIVPEGPAARRIYSGELFYQGENLLVNTSIAHGDEDHLHCAAIDTALEVVRRRLGAKGGAISTGALGYFLVLAKHGCDSWPRNLLFAASAAMETAASIGWPEAAFEDSAVSVLAARPVSSALNSVRCWACRADIEVTHENRGKKVKCPRCGKKQAVPK
jgi:DNA-directed RNA polymerase subunit RPC12/RpoP